ncbi:ARM repeat-containing protein [Obba rivulosa]|uniref:ARM repeat-containing protein n=1 Tax=Obba rivulosa TaxID=1052685 RepID=A0A8E2DPK1_9APHY|nr:ARM repeat-containing protein [Obba rivulosa]
MDVPFSASGAMSRAQYALVRKVESASSPQLADQLLLVEIDAIRERLSASALSLAQCKECLIMLLYCSMSVSSGTGADLEFALPHAVNLAEAGKTIQDKRTGYLFCIEAMPPEHELQLMLVNTLRKDLESPSIPRICLALDTLIQLAFSDVIPAIQARLFELLSHTSPYVRRRSLLAFKTLSAHEPDILKEIVDKTVKRLSDPDPSVVSAALAVSMIIAERGFSDKAAFKSKVSIVLKSAWQAPPSTVKNGLLLKVLNALRGVQMSADDLRLVLEIVRSSSQAGRLNYSLLYQSFLAVRSSTPKSVVQAQNGSGIQLIRSISHLLTSEDPNTIYAFISCLECIEACLWAGTTPEIPVVLEEWEVERVMKVLDSDDRAIRMKTLRILQRVDPGIVETYYTQMLNGDTASAVHDSDEITRRLFEIADVVSGEDGETYVRYMKNILQALEDTGPLEKRQVLAVAMEDILLHVRSAPPSFRDGYMGAMSATLVEPQSEIGPSLMVIICALISEYLATCPIAPVKILDALSERIATYSASIQDACLLCMIRASADCNEVPAEILERIRNLHEHSGRHIRRRCDQFLHFGRAVEALRHVLGKVHSYALPDVLAALEAHEVGSASLALRSPPLKPVQSPESSSSRNSPTPSKLRYDAYEPPKPVHRLRRLSSSSRNSDDGSSRFIGQPHHSEDPLARTLTPGDLALAAGQRDLQPLAKVSTRDRSDWGPAFPSTQPLSAAQSADKDELASRVDLITLDSPFIAEPSVSLVGALNPKPDFEITWNSLESFNSRGWSEATVEIVLGRLQGSQWQPRVIPADHTPFQGTQTDQGTDVQNLASTEAVALLRLKQSEDGCLWRLRCADEGLGASIKVLLAEI